MRYRIPLILVSLGWCGLALEASAQTATTAGGGGEPPKRARAMSGALSGGLTFQAVKPKPVEESDVDLRDVDRPRNEIIRLPKYIVEGERPPIFAERNLYSHKNLQKLALSRYMGGALNNSQLGVTGKDYSMQMYEDEERLKNMGEVERHVAFYELSGDDARAAKAQKDYNSTFLRKNDARSAEMSKLAGQRY